MLGSKKYRLIQAELDTVGVYTTINRIGPNRFWVHINMEIVKQYKLRRSANRFLLRLHNKHFKKLITDAHN